MTPAMLRWVLDSGKDTTRCRRAGCAWVLGRDCRLRPAAREGGGWRSSGRQGALGELRLIDLLHKRAKMRASRGAPGSGEGGLVRGEAW
jgi:hypothetical protein